MIEFICNHIVIEHQFYQEKRRGCEEIVLEIMRKDKKGS